MKNPKTYNEVKEANYILKMMEDVFGHRITSWSPKDTFKLKNKLRQPMTNAEKEQNVKVIEPLMKRKALVPPGKDAFLDSFVDLGTRISPDDYAPTKDKDEKELDALLGVDLT